MFTDEEKLEGSCGARTDEQHCDCWWDGEPCCACGFDGPPAESASEIEESSIETSKTLMAKPLDSEF